MQENQYPNLLIFLNELTNKMAERIIVCEMVDDMVEDAKREARLAAE